MAKSKEPLTDVLIEALETTIARRMENTGENRQQAAKHIENYLRDQILARQ